MNESNWVQDEEMLEAPAAAAEGGDVGFLLS
jgi:hypothetical protein